MLGFFLYVTLVKCEIPSNDIYIKCQENEEFTRCPGCEFKCGEESQPCPPLPCDLNPLHIRGRCQCKSGYLRHDNGTCVSSDQCPSNSISPAHPPCGPNEQLYPRQICEGTCANPNPIACPFVEDRHRRCQCKFGYVRFENSTCVLEEECPQNQSQISNNVIQNLTCDNVECAEGYDCVMRRRFCPSLHFPCDRTPRPVCIARNSSFPQAPPLNCGNVHCDTGYHCQMSPRICPMNTISRCVGEPRCVKDEGNAINKTCANFQCADDETCVMRKQCPSLRVSCDVEPRPKCVKRTNTSPFNTTFLLTCDGFQCKSNETCIMKPSICPSLRISCDTTPKPSCVPIQQAPSNPSLKIT
uniref:Follistatin-like domain-containing protein n=1 Tax=Acrobeloides nanus TaxID=290746 RepID=A0A914EGX4_9BILA